MTTTGHHTKPWYKGGCAGCLFSLIGSFAVIWAAWQVFAYQFERSQIPDRLSIEHKIFGQEETYGFGPGGNERGLKIYRLASEDADRLIAIASQLTDDDSIRAAVGKRDGRDYYEWRRTPVSGAESLRNWGEEDLEGEQPSIEHFLDGFGFVIEAEPELVDQVDQILNSPGSYYSAGPGTSLIIVAPQEQLVIHAFAG